MRTRSDRVRRKPLVLVFGTFDVLHPGHLDFLRQAARLGRVVVSVSRDRNAMMFKGGKPVFNERDRLAIVSQLKPVEKAVLGGVGNYLPHAKRIKPDIIALGYDQRAFERHIRADLASGRLKVRITRLRPYNPRVHKSTAYKQRIHKAVRHQGNGI